MKVIHSSIFRAVCAIIVGVLLIQYREQTVTWITIAIGVLFFLSGVISLASYWAAKRNAEKMQGQILSDSNGKPIMGMMPKFPLVTRQSYPGIAACPDASGVYRLADVHPGVHPDFGCSDPVCQPGFSS